MLKQAILTAIILWLAGCTVAPTSTVEPPSRSGSYEQPRSGAVYTAPHQQESRRGGGYVAPTPAPDSVRRAPVVAYSDNSTGVTAADVLLREGKAYHQRGQYADAANHFERAIRLAPRSPALYLALARTRLALNDFNSAIQMANRALSLLPSDGWGVADARADAWTIIADSREASGDRKGAAVARSKAREYW